MDEKQNLLKNLIDISRIDSRIAGVIAEKRKLEDKLQTKQKAVKSAELDSREKAVALQERRNIYQREDRHLKESQQKLIDRRKSLTTLGSYKLQMAAEREIEASAKQLSAQEEHFIKMLDQIDELQTAAQVSEAAYLAVKAEYEVIEKDAKEAFITCEQRLKEYLQEREVILPLIDSRELTIYNRVRERFPMDPVVPVQQNGCGGCFMGLGPQVVVEISRARALVRCRGCGRIMFLAPEESKEE